MADKRTYADRAEYLKKAVVKRRKKLRQRAVDILGAKCLICSYSKCLDAFDFHHVDPSTKEFNLSLNNLTRSWERVEKELRKCVLLCANCHREVHHGITQLPTVTSVEE